ncbi:hypothetical protein ACHAW6_011876 [Cyclotella cf. meneghiniana]
MLHYLCQMSHPDIQYTTHIVAKYSSNPRQKNGHAISYIVLSLIKTCDLGLNFKPDTSKGFYCYAGTDFSGKCNQDFAELAPSMVKSRSGWFHFVCQLSMALSTTDAEYIALSQALCHIIPIMVLEEMGDYHVQIICEAPCMYCKDFEDNSVALGLVRLPKLQPCTKHITVCFHHFWEHV